MGAQQPTVNTPTLAYEALEEYRALPRTLMGGTIAMRKAGQQFMPSHPAEKPEVYSVRLHMTTLYGAFADTVASQVGKVFMKPVTANQDVTGQMVDYLKNIDGQGNALSPFAMQVFTDAMTEGVSFILVDMPKVLPSDPNAAQPTLADQIAQGARPYWCHVKAADLIDWRSEVIRGAQTLTRVRIRETAVVQDGDWGEKLVNRVRVLIPGGFQLWEEREAAVTDDATRPQWIMVDQGFTTLGFIPLVPVYTNRTGFFEGKPPLQALADLCMEHWNSSSEHRRALTFLRFAMLAISGVDEKGSVEIGPDKVLWLPPNATASYVEHGGSGIDAGMKDLEAIEARMASAGMSLSVELAGKVTATASAIDTAESNAGLKAVAQGLKDSLDLALEYTAAFMGSKVRGNAGTVTVFTEFAEEPADADPNPVIKLRIAGELSRETFFSELVRRHILRSDFNIEEEIKRIEDEGGAFGHPDEIDIILEQSDPNGGAPTQTPAKLVRNKDTGNYAVQQNQPSNNVIQQ